MRQQLRRSLRSNRGGWPAEWAHFAVALVFQGVDPMDAKQWPDDEMADALAIIDELNADAKRRK